jgi:NodT family efflux transporter outer membrane factor (OMF) lipoprotein
MSRTAMKKILLVTTATMLLSACMVGPDFKTPAAPDAQRYTETELPAKTASAEGMAGAAQTFAQDKDLPADWWTLFHSDALNTLVQESLKANPDLGAAMASLHQAKENYYAARGDLFPSVDAGFSPTREKFNSSAYGLTGFPSSIFTLYDASVSVSYTFDVFGGIRRELESAGALVDYQRYEYQAAYLSLTGNVVTAAIQEANLREQIKETQDIIGIETQQYNVLNDQFNVGAVAKSAVLEQQATLAQEQATLPGLEKQLAQTRNLLATLAGRLPDKGVAQSFDLASLHLPEEIPVTLPSKLVEQRPDVKAAEAQMHAASAEIGVATANLLPQFTLSGTYGSESTYFSHLMTGGAEFWSLGGDVLQPIFHGGTLWHERKASVEAYKKAGSQYRSTVLQAFRNVADSLRASQYDADALLAQVNYAKSASDSLSLTQTQFKVGAISYPQLLDAQRLYAQARISLVQAQATRFADTAALFEALGGGWNVAPAKPAASAPAPAPTIAPAVTNAANPATQPSPVSEKKS